jgi:hypothetical protein
MNLFCNLCKSVGHDEKYCHAFNLMREHTSDEYRCYEEYIYMARGKSKQME